MRSLASFPSTLRLFVAVAIAASSTVALAQTPACSVGSATIQLPSGTGQVQSGSPAAVQVNAQVGNQTSPTPSGCDITAVRLYINNRANQTVYVNAPAATVGFRPTLPDGIYNAAGVAYDNKGYAFVSSTLPLYIGNTDATIYAVAPTNNVTTGNPVTFIAYTRWDATGPNQQGANQTILMRFYVDNQNVYQSSGPIAGFQKSFAPGVHHLVIVAYNGNGAGHLTKALTFTVQ